MFKKLKSSTAHILTLAAIFWTSYLLFIPLKVETYEELIRNSIMFITISAGFYRSGLNVMIEFIKSGKNKTKKIRGRYLNLEDIKFYYNSCTYISIISALILIIFSGFHTNLLPEAVKEGVIPLIIVNAYCSGFIFRILMECIATRNPE